MKTVWSRRSERHVNCEGISRRDFLKVGTLGFTSLTLAEFLHLRAAQADPRNPLRDKNCILLFMNGGPSHIDTWDPKPEAPAEYRGEFNAIPTNVDGIQICEHMPRLAQVAHHYAIIRTLTSPEGSHERACHYMLTGYRELPTMQFPAYGSVVLREKGFRTAMPPYIAVPQTLRGGGPGYLGAAFQPFSVGDPGTGDNFRVRDIHPVVADERLRQRLEMLREANAPFRAAVPDANVTALEQFYTKAYDIVNSPEVKRAFDLSKEPRELREAYGRNSLGQGCLLARRLIEAGARFVTVSRGGWDTHGNNFQQLRNTRLPELDQAMGTLIRDLADRGMLADTLVIWMGEFGRTPRINRTAGRDHWPRCQSVVLAGGGIRGGQVIGKSDATASLPEERPVTPEDLAVTIYHALGIDPHKTYTTSTGRPIRIAEGGTVIRELF